MDNELRLDDTITPNILSFRLGEKEKDGKLYKVLIAKLSDRLADIIRCNTEHSPKEIDTIISEDNEVTLVVPYELPRNTCIYICEAILSIANRYNIAQFTNNILSKYGRIRKAHELQDMIVEKFNISDSIDTYVSEFFICLSELTQYKEKDWY